MKHFINVIAFFVILLNVSAQQVNKATYSFYVSDETFGKDSELQLSINESAENNPLFLYFSKERSVFTSYNLEQGRIPDTIDALSISGSINFYNVNLKRLINSHRIKNENYNTKNFLPSWELTSESKIIDGYTCYKAKGTINRVSEGIVNESKIEAWYCPDLPYNVGPNIFVGLPGLVVYAVNSLHCIYKLEKIEFDIKEKMLEYNEMNHVIDEVALDKLLSDLNK